MASRTFGLRPALLILFGVFLVGLRWMTRSRYLFDLDSVLFARALDDYNLRLDPPHPALPGYYLYIQLGKAMRWLLETLGLGRDANLAFVVLSALFGLLLVILLYYLGLELFRQDRRTAAAAALLGLSGPIFWYQSNIASPRIAEGFFAALIVYLGVRLRNRGESWTFWLLPVALAVAGGVRQQSLLYLLPFALWATWRMPLLSRRLPGALLLALGIAVWAAPTFRAAGGLGEYLRLTRALNDFFVVQGTGVFYGGSVGESLRRWAVNNVSIVIYAVYTCLLGLPLLVYAGLQKRFRSQPEQAAASSIEDGTVSPGLVLLIATVPALLFFSFVHVQQIGHFLGVAPFLTLACARAATCPRRSAAWQAGALGALALTNLAFTLWYPGHLIRDRIGTATVAAIRERNDFIQITTDAVRAAGSPEETLVLTTPLSCGFVSAYLPEYRFYLLAALLGGGVTGSGPMEVFTNGKRAVRDPLLRDDRSSLPNHCVAAPPQARRFVTVGHESDLASLLDPETTAGAVTRPAPGLPSLAVVTRPEATVLCVEPPGRLKFLPADPEYAP